MLNQISREDIRLVYTFVTGVDGYTKKLGSGSFGTVRVAHKTVNPSAKFAVKSIKREQFEQKREDEEELIQELMILRSVDHPNIVKLYEIYLDHRYLHIVTEMLEGGPIRPEKALRTKLSESEVARMVR